MKTDINYAQVTTALQQAISQYEQILASLGQGLSGDFSEQIEQTTVRSQNQGIILGLQLAMQVLDQFADNEPKPS